MDAEDLALELRDARRRVFDLRCQKVTDKIEDTTQFKQARKRVARILTEMNQRSQSNAEVAS